MQLRFSPEELTLLAEILFQEGRKLRSQDSLPAKRELYAELEDKILAGNLRLGGDELEELSVLLVARKNQLSSEIARADQAAVPPDLQRQRKLLERILERVNEACVMF